MGQHPRGTALSSPTAEAVGSRTHATRPREARYSFAIWHWLEHKEPISILLPVTAARNPLSALLRPLLAGSPASLHLARWGTSGERSPDVAI